MMVVVRYAAADRGDSSGEREVVAVDGESDDDDEGDHGGEQWMCSSRIDDSCCL